MTTEQTSPVLLNRCASSPDVCGSQNLKAKVRGFFASYTSSKMATTRPDDRYRRFGFHGAPLQTEIDTQLSTTTASKSPRHLRDAQEVPVSPARLQISGDQISRIENIVSRKLFSHIDETHETILSPEIEVTNTVCSTNCQSACFRALQLPEIVENILQQVDLLACLSVQTSPSNKSSTVTSIESDKCQPFAQTLSSCLIVDRVFFWATKRVLSRRVDLRHMDTIARYLSADAASDNLCRDLTLHRLKSCDQEQFDGIKQYRLRSLELYVCPKLVPNAKMLESGTLFKIALPGCGLVNDATMTAISRSCRNLEILDLRACELVSDAGILEIARYCPQLAYLNVGRVKHPKSITDLSITEISKRTAVETLGLAGCAITDESVLAIMRFRGAQIERLSMNQCHGVTDLSLRELIIHSPKLQVLEVVGCERILDARAMSYFKIKSGALVETSEKLACDMRIVEREIRQEIDAAKKRQMRVTRRISTI